MMRFHQPEWLWAALIVVPMVLIGWRVLRDVDLLRRVSVLALRSLLVIALAVALAGPHGIRRHNQLTVVGILDVSGSVRRFADLPETMEIRAASTMEFLREWFRKATETREPDDRFGLVVFDGQAIVVSTPTTGRYTDDNLDIEIREGTNIADAIRLAMALFPADTGRRMVLVSDGNQTAGDALEAGRQAAGGALRSASGAALKVPIDVAPITYNVVNDVQVLRVESPGSAQPGQTVSVRMVLEATRPTPGRLTLLREGVPVDLNGAEAGVSRHLALPPGQSVHLAQVSLDELPINRFQAVFEPDDPDDDILADNNVAESFTATPSRGAVLIVDRRGAVETNALAGVLSAAQLPVRVVEPSMMPNDLLSLQSYDLVILQDVAAYEMTTRQHELLSRYVNDMGGGLVMTGGENSFGAGGWTGTAVEGLLPVELNPPREMRLPSTALVLVLDKSGSMSQHVAGARATQQEVANEGAAMAIESLRGESLVGVVVFDFVADVHVPLQRNDDPKRIADMVRTIRPAGGTNIGAGLEMARQMLREVKVEQKRVVCLSDGVSGAGEMEEVVKLMAEEGIKVSTIAVGDGADYQTLEKLAVLGDGEFYAVRNPRMLPRVLVDSVQIVNKPLIREGLFSPVIRPTGSTLTATMSDAPPMEGLVITGPRADPRAVLEMTDEQGEPLFAHWQAGLGRVAAFTSQADGKWARRWMAWGGYGGFWAQVARMMARPAMSREAELAVDIQDGRLQVSFEATGEQAGFLDDLQVEGTIYAPGGAARAVRLRQVAPGRYEATADAPEAGNYIVALSPRRGDRRLAPAIGGASRATSEEFRRYRSNLALLDELVELTGGRRLDLARPGAVDLFDRSGMPQSVSLLPIWRELLWIVLGVMLLDVASRRVAWNAAILRGWVMGALTKVAPARVRGEAAAARLATLRAKGPQREPREAQPVTAATIRPPSSRTMPGDEADAASTKMTETAKQKAEPAGPKKPSGETVSAALDVILGRQKTTKDGAAAKKDGEKKKGEESGETTSGLLAAKRRARERFGDGG